MAKFKRCIIKGCGDIIPDLRLAMAPNTVTCSQACGRVHHANQVRTANRLYRRRKRDTDPAKYKVK